MSRRPRHVVKRGRFYYLRIMVNGRVVRKSLGTELLAEANRLAQLHEARLRGQVSSVSRDGPKTVSEFSEQWLDEYVRVRSTNARAYTLERWLRKHIRMFGGRPIQDIQVRDLFRLRYELEKTGLASGTVASVLSGFRGMLSSL